MADMDNGWKCYKIVIWHVNSVVWFINDPVLPDPFTIADSIIRYVQLQ